ncbi:MAG TPA: hypothetical protein VI612_01575, partial [Candidatus Nanoarchaeia archaeon]|nr:hypothetical protein [Candidatus Nanoarchaeia archaeon]
MAHIDSVYSFGKRRLPIWIVLRDIIEKHFLKDGKLRAIKSGGLRLRGEEPNLSSLVDEMVNAESRDENFMEKYALLNAEFLRHLDELKGREIIFTDPVSPTKLDPQFLFSYMKELGIPFPDFIPAWYASSKPGKVWHDPYSPMFAQTDAILLMSALNPMPWSGKIIWPVSFVPFPSEVSADGTSLAYVFPGAFNLVDRMITDEGRIALGSRKKIVGEHNLFYERKIGSFECNPVSFDAAGLEDLLTLDEMSSSGRIKQLVESKKMTWEQAKERVRAEIPYDVFLKREMTALFYALILEKLDIDPVLFASKNSVSHSILSRALKISGKRKLKLVGPGDRGPIDISRKSPYGCLEASALERLNGFVVNPRVSPVFEPRKVKSFLTKEDLKSRGLALHPCPYAPVWCEKVYPDKYSCARDAKETDSCSRDLFDSMKSPAYLRSWVAQHNSTHPGQEVGSVAEFVIHECRKRRFYFYSAEQIAFLLNRGPNFEVFTSTDFRDEEELDADDERRRKAKLSWFGERGSDKIFPFIHEDNKALNPFGRISAFNVKCDLARLIGMHPELPPESQSSEAAVFGTMGHTLTNGSSPGGFMLQELLWSALGLPPVKREKYTERAVRLNVGDVFLSGHPDCVLLKAPGFMQGEELNGKSLDLII